MPSTMKQTAFRLTEEDLAILDEAKRRAGLVSRTEAFRLVLREWARASGVGPKPTARRKTKTRK
jgi:hypothetical protein